MPGASLLAQTISFVVASLLGGRLHYIEYDMIWKEYNEMV